MGTIILLQKPDFSEGAVLEPTTMAAWVEFVKRGESHAGNLGEELESFLVFTLMRFEKRTDIFSFTLALAYLNATAEPVSKKKEGALSEVGDVSLLLAGLYPERSKRLNVSTSYFTEMGVLAFADLADSLENRGRESLATLYRHASNGFSLMTNVLCAARPQEAMHTEHIIKKPGFLTPR